MSKLSESTKTAIEVVVKSINRLNTRYVSDKVCIKQFITERLDVGDAKSINFTIALVNKSEDGIPDTSLDVLTETTLHNYKLSLLYNEKLEPVVCINNIILINSNTDVCIHHSAAELNKGTKGFIIYGIPNSTMLLDAILVPMYMVAKSAVNTTKKEK